MSDPVSHTEFTASQSAGGVAQPFSATRLVAGGLSLLLVLAFALAAGVPAGQLLATVGVTSHGDTDRAVAPQVVERQVKRLAQERPVPAGSERRVARAELSDGPLCAGRSGVAKVSVLVREALLALPPPVVAA